MLGRGITADEQRALSTWTGVDGGFLVPFVLDPTVILTSDAAVNPYRRIARMIQLANANTWKGVSSAGVVASFDPEFTEVSDDTPDFEQPDLYVEKAQAFVEFSFEADQDIPGLAGELATMFQEAKDELEADKYTNGAGHDSDEPEGILTGATTTIDSSGSGAIAIDDTDALEAGLPPRWRSRAEYLASRFIYTKLKRLATADDQGFWVPIQGGLANTAGGNTGYSLNGYPTNECSEMPAAVTAGTLMMVLGDWRQFAVVDRIGMATELVPHLMGASFRPTGKRGLLAHWRTTSGVLVPGAFRVLKSKS